MAVISVLDYVPPFARHGCCFFCLTAESKQYFLTNIDIDFEGAVIVCTACAIDLGSFAGMVSRAQLDQARGEALSQSIRANEAERKVEQLERDIEAILRHVPAEA